MKIIGGHDYYDSGLSYGIDDKVILVRHKNTDSEDSPDIVKWKDCPLRPGPTGLMHRWSRDDSVTVGDSSYLLKPITVYVAGKRYGGMKFQHEYYKASYPDTTGAKDFVVWGHDVWLKVVETNNLPVSTKRKGQIDGASTADRLAEHFTNEVCNKDELDWLIENHVAIALYCDDGGQRRDWWRINPIGLRAYEFMKRLDAFTMFQELSMFIGGVLPGGQSPMVKIADEKVRIHKAGFDPKWSFRKHKDDPKLTK